MANSNQMLLDWLSGPVMTELVQSQDIAPGLPKPFPDAFYQPSDTTCVGVNVMWDAVQGVRQNATIVDYLSPSRGVDTQARTRRQAVALGTRENTPLDSEVIMALQSNVPLWQDRMRMVLRQKMADFRQRADNLRITLVNSVIATNRISYDRNGNILPTPNGNTIPPVVDFQALHAGANALIYTDHWPNTSLAVGDWSNASTDIPSSIRAMRQGFVFQSNYVATNLIYGRDIPGYMYNNTAMQTYLSRQPSLNQQFMDTNEVPQGLLDLQWHPGYMAYYIDQNGAQQTWVAHNEIIIFPEINPGWYEYVSCSMPCPTGLVAPNAPIESFLSNCPPVKGYSSYCIPSYDPIKISVIAQDFSMPISKNPQLPWQATVTA